MVGAQVTDRSDGGRVPAAKSAVDSLQSQPITSVLGNSSTHRSASGIPAVAPPRGRGGERGASRQLGSDEAEHVARALLRRYGVVFWKLLEREASWLPSWRELLRVYHRLEARGEIRGGRFVEGLVGEQFALPEAIAPLRAIRQRADDGELVCVSGSDPLNLVGTVLVGDKVPALPGSRVLYRDGMPIAALAGGKVTSLIELPAADMRLAKQVLLRLPSSLRDAPATS